jgi:hypothetical protein
MIEIIYFILGYGLSKLIAGSGEHKQGKFPSLTFGKIHIHHWVWAIFFTLLFLTLGNIIWFFFLGITVQGLLYKDRFNFKRSR